MKHIVECTHNYNTPEECSTCIKADEDIEKLVKEELDWQKWGKTIGDPNSPVNPEGIQAGDFLLKDMSTSSYKTSRLVTAVEVDNTKGKVLTGSVSNRNTIIHWEYSIRGIKLFKRRGELTPIQAIVLAEEVSKIKYD